MAFQQLLADSSVKFNPTTGEVTFENSLTVHATTPYAPRAKVTMGISATTGLPVAKASFKTPPITGRINRYTYLTEDFGIDIEITRLQPRTPEPRLITQPTRPEPRLIPRPTDVTRQRFPQHYPVYQPPSPTFAPDALNVDPSAGRGRPRPPSNLEILVGSALMGAALAVVVVTIVEDIATVGAGTLNDPVSGAIAAGMATRGWTMVRSAPLVTQGVRTIGNWATRAAPHVERAWQAVELGGRQLVSIMVQGATIVPAPVYVR